MLDKAEIDSPKAKLHIAIPGNFPDTKQTTSIEIVCKWHLSIRANDEAREKNRFKWKIEDPLCECS